MAFASTIAFAHHLSHPLPEYFFCGITGGIGWLVYLFCTGMGLGVVTASFFATVALAWFSRIFAFRRKAPVTIFLITGIFPLVPGAGIYYTGYHPVYERQFPSPLQGPGDGEDCRRHRLGDWHCALFAPCSLQLPARQAPFVKGAFPCLCGKWPFKKTTPASGWTNSSPRLFPNLPQAMLYKCIRKKDIKVNGKRCEISTRLREGDVVSLYMKEEFFQKEEREEDFLKAPAKLNVLYEDENVMLLDKRPGADRPPGRKLPLRLPDRPGATLPLRQRGVRPSGGKRLCPRLGKPHRPQHGGHCPGRQKRGGPAGAQPEDQGPGAAKALLLVWCAAGLPKRKGCFPATWRKTNPKTGCTSPKSPGPGGQEHPHQVPGLGGAAGLLPGGGGAPHRGAPTRSGPTSPPSATLWPGTGSTGKTRSTRRPAFPTRPFTPTSWPLISGPMEGFSPIWTAGSSPCRTCGFWRNSARCLAALKNFHYNERQFEFF